jgi:hypothetical protein
MGKRSCGACTNCFAWKTKCDKMFDDIPCSTCVKFSKTCVTRQRKRQGRPPKEAQTLPRSIIIAPKSVHRAYVNKHIYLFRIAFSMTHALGGRFISMQEVHLI